MAYGPLTYRTNGGDKMVVASGGEIDIESGGTFNIAGVTVTASAADLNTSSGASTGTTSAVWTLDSDNAAAAKLAFNTNSATGAGFTATVVPDNIAGNITLTLPSTTGTIALTSDTAVDLDLGSDGAAGSLDIFPAGATNGKLIITATNMGGARNLSITNAAIGAARAYTIPEAGGDGYFAMTTGANSLLVDCNSGNRTMSLSGNVTTGADVTFSGAFAAEIAVPDASTWTLPAGGGTLTTVTGAETGTTSSVFTVDSDSGTGKLAITNTTGGTNHTITLQTTQTTAARTITLPDSTTTLAGLATTQTFTGNQTVTGTIDLQGNVTASAGHPDFDWSDSTGDFTTSAGTVTLEGDVIIQAGKDLGAAPGIGAVDLSPMTGAFATPTGAGTLSGTTNVAANKNLTCSAGTTALDMSLGTGVTKTTTGTFTIGGTTSLAADKNIACAAGTTAVDWSLGTGAFKSTTGANQLSGAVTIADATTPSLTCAASKTNSGFVSVLGKTSGGIKVLPIDAGTSLLTISNEAQTQACSMLVPDLNVATGQFVCNAADQTVRVVSGASDRTVTLGGDITTTGDLITVGDDSLTFTTSAATDVTLPTTGTLTTTGGTETLTNKTIDGDDNTIQDLRCASPGQGIAATTGVESTPAIPFIVTFTPTNGAGETLVYTVPAGKTLRVLDVRGYKTNGNGGAGDTVTITNVANAITDAIVTNLNDKLVFQAASYDDAFRDVAASTELRCTTAFNTDCACSVNVTCMWV